MKRACILAITLLFASLAASRADAQQTNPSGNDMEKSRPEAITIDSGQPADPGQTVQQQNQLQGEFVRIERAYTSVIKYYNSDLDDMEALQIARLVLYHAAQFRLDPRLLMAVIVAESRFHPDAVSSKGAMGLGQLMPGTARTMGIKNPFDVKDNIYGTACYLRKMYDRWADSEQVLDLMLASYNAGPEAVAHYNGIPPFNETRGYVTKVKKLFRFFVYGY
jgi:soluble lytic murein transglycosylase-like protein